jgi:hypothetical protein
MPIVFFKWRRVISTPGSLLLLCTLASSGTAAPSAIIHESYSHRDQWAQCVKALSSKPLLFVEWNWRSQLACPTSMTELEAELTGKGVLVPGDKWDLLFGKNFMPPLGGTPPEYWRRTTVTVNIKNWVQGSGSRQATGSELKELGAKALEMLRPSLTVMTPVAPKATTLATPEDHTANFTLELSFDIHRLSPNGPESIIGIFRQNDSAPSGRMIYGEYRGGKPVFLWDSPELPTRLLSLGYRDVDHDGIEEIMFVATPMTRRSSSELVIFKSNGWELTRQLNCLDSNSNIEGSACPIEGGDISFIPDIHVGPDIIQVEWDETQQKDIYVLEYTYQKQARQAREKH